VETKLAINGWRSYWKRLPDRLPLALHFMINCTRKISANQNVQTQILAL
jgi:hypothetical protein